METRSSKPRPPSGRGQAFHGRKVPTTALPDAKKVPSFHVVPAILERSLFDCDGSVGWRIGDDQPQLLGRGLEQQAEELGVGSPGNGSLPLPATDQVAGDAELAFPHLDTDPNQPPDDILLGPAPRQPLSP
jgi:hypothetical protein